MAAPLSEGEFTIEKVPEAAVVPETTVAGSNCPFQLRKVWMFLTAIAFDGMIEVAEVVTFAVTSVSQAALFGPQLFTWSVCWPADALTCALRLVAFVRASRVPLPSRE